MFKTSEDLLSTSEILEILDIPRYRLLYLFESRRLKEKDFIRLGNRQRLYRRSDIAKIKQVLFDMTAK